MQILVLLLSSIVSVTIGRPEAGLPYDGLKYHFQQHQNGLLRDLGDGSGISQQQLPEVQIATKFAPSSASYHNGVIAGNHPINVQEGYTNLREEEEELTKERPPQPQLTQSLVKVQQQLRFQNEPPTNLDSYNNIYDSYNDIASSGYQYPTSIVQKHIYVHVPPKDFEEEDIIQQPRVHHQGGLKQKHYKIIFIKAPSGPSTIPQLIAPPPVQNEEKTIIYVLHKKPEQVQDVVIPTAPPTQPSKPEVYFIKYKTTKNEEVQRPVYHQASSLLPLNAPRNNPIVEVDEFVNQLQNQETNSEDHVTPIQHSNLYEKQIAATNPLLQPLPQIVENSQNRQQLQEVVPEQLVIPEVQTIGNVPFTPLTQYGPPNRFQAS